MDECKIGGKKKKKTIRERNIKQKRKWRMKRSNKTDENTNYQPHEWINEWEEKKKSRKWSE